MKRAETNWQAIGLIVTLFLGFSGFVVTYCNNIAIEQRKARTELVSSQLENLYGPLLALTHASEVAWNEFRKKHPTRKGGFFNDENPPTIQQVEDFRHWMRVVLMPLNIQMEDVITKNMHLIVDPKVPEPFLNLLAHVSNYKAVIAKWNDSDTRDARFVKDEANTSGINFPSNIHEYVRVTFNKLKTEQNTLLAKSTRI